MFNKCDLGVSEVGLAHGKEHVAYISAATGQGVEQMLLKIEEMLHEGSRRATFFIPNDQQKWVAKLYAAATVEDVEYGADGVRVTAVVDAQTYGQLRNFDVDKTEVNGDEW